VLSTINALLSQLVSPTLHTAILITPQGHLVAYAAPGASEDRIRILAGLGSEVWREGIEGDKDEGEEYESDGSEETARDDLEEEEMGMLECELGRILVYPIYAAPDSSSPKQASPPTQPQKAGRAPILLLALNGADDEPWGMMHTKARALGKYLAEPLASVGDRLSPGTSPAKLRSGVVWAR